MPSSTLQARCICSKNKLLCPHKWAQWLLSGSCDPEALTFASVSYNQFLSNLRADLVAVGANKLFSTTCGSHGFRHGAAMDIHDQDGLASAIARGEWKSMAIRSYVPSSAIESKALAEALCQVSDDES